MALSQPKSSSFVSRFALVVSLAAGTALVGCSGAEASTMQAQSSAALEGDVRAANAIADRPNDASHYAHLVKRFDKNADGIVQVAELPERMQKFLGRADANADGALTADELAAEGAKMRSRMFEHADKDKNGALDAKEVGEHRWEKLQAADADKDGTVTLAEIQKAEADGTLKMDRGPGGPRGPRGPWEPGRGDHGRGPRPEGRGSPDAPPPPPPSDAPAR
ncbi:MAG: hypothetical protein U0169_23305 [Polyangiaceae bacterium]